MKSLKPDQKQLILDYYLGIAADDEQRLAQELLTNDSRAKDFLALLEQGLMPLRRVIAVETCPEHLAQKTIDRLKQAKLRSEMRITELLEQEQAKPVTANRGFWRSFTELAAAAAMIAAVAGLAFPTLNNARSKYWQAKCGAQLASVARGISQYSNDNKELPTVAMTAGAPWWKIGDQGNENVSNTRHLWLLVKNNYVKPQEFVCPTRIQGKPVRLDGSQTAKLCDFPSRKYVTYSFRVISSANPAQMLRSEKILISDMNPVFERIPRSCHDELNLRLCDEMRTANSSNHRKRGQNILTGHGAVRFVTTRHVGKSNDDIFTIQNTETYKGVERPCTEDDDFLAP